MVENRKSVSPDVDKIKVKEATEFPNGLEIDISLQIAIDFGCHIS